MTFTKNSWKLAIASISLAMVISSCSNEPKAPPPPPIVENKTPAKAEPVKMPAEKADSNAKFVYLTFDDGPLPGSEAINKLVLDNKFKASVFVVGKHTNNGRNSLRLLKDYMKNP